MLQHHGQTAQSASVNVSPATNLCEGATGHGLSSTRVMCGKGTCRVSTTSKELPLFPGFTSPPCRFHDVSPFGALGRKGEASIADKAWPK